jgi:hypothetical protein
MKGRIGLAAVLVASLMAIGASPAYAAGKKAGTITQGSTVILLNTSGFVKVWLTCNNGTSTFNFSGFGNPVDYWLDPTTSAGSSVSHGNNTGAGRVMSRPEHLDWSISRGTKVALGQVYVDAASNGNDCLYTSLVS